MTTHRFLSPEWIEAVGRLKQAREGSAVDAPDLVVNATVTGVPFGDEQLEVHSRRGPMIGWEPGHAEGADLAITVDYYTAKALVLDPSPGFDALAQSLANGTLRIEGDRERLRSWWKASRFGTADATTLEDEVRALTS